MFTDDDPDSSWVVAAGIEDPEEDDNYPVVRFIKNDGSTMSDVFPVPIGEVLDERECSFPRVDCTYLDDGCRKVEVDVVYRYANNDYNWRDIENEWDIQVIQMIFKYNLNDDWELMSSAYLYDYHMSRPLTGQTTPDIAINQKNGDIYCAWSDLSEEICFVFYKRYDGNSWSLSPYQLQSNYRRHSPWFLSLDVGLVSGLPGTMAPVRVVGFAYTGGFTQLWDPDPEGPRDDLWGFRPIVGWWVTGFGEDTNHNAQYILVNPDFDPEEPEEPEEEWGNKYEAGMIRVDIPGDDAAGHGAAAVFMQDTCDEYYGDYEAYGIESLTCDFTWLSDPGLELFERAVFPSLAIHDKDGTMASVTYLAREDEQDNWAAWATLWDLSSNSVAEPTIISYGAQGSWSLSLEEILFHDWGSGSSLAVAGANDEYWAAWSDKYGEEVPVRILGRMGYAEE